MRKGKTKTDMKAFGETLSKEMVMQILSRLPPKSLMRFKCVHKSWHSLINNPRLAANHLHFYSENSSSTCILLNHTVAKRTETHNQEVLVFSFLHLPNDDGNTIPNVVDDLIFPPFVGLDNRGQFIELEHLESIDIIGHCDGIICLSLYTGDLILCNPVIKEFKIVPELTILQDWTGCAMEFGYDPKSDDYTIVNVVSYDEGVYEERLVHSPPKAEVYTLGTDSWREINTDILETETGQTAIFWPFFFQMYFKGTFYWLEYEQNKEFMSCYRRQEEEYVRQVIVLFDTSDEVFRSMLLPDSFYEPSFGVYAMRLGRWKESIALYGFHCFTYFEIWVNDGNGSWTKHVTFEPLEDYFVLSLAFWKSEEVIMVGNDGRIVSYNVATEKF